MTTFRDTLRQTERELLRAQAALLRYSVNNDQAEQTICLSAALRALVLMRGQLEDLFTYQNVLRGRVDDAEHQQASTVPPYTAPGHGRWR